MSEDIGQGSQPVGAGAPDAAPPAGTPIRLTEIGQEYIADVEHIFSLFKHIPDGVEGGPSSSATKRNMAIFLHSLTFSSNPPSPEEAQDVWARIEQKLARYRRLEASSAEVEALPRAATMLAPPPATPSSAPQSIAGTPSGSGERRSGTVTPAPRSARGGSPALSSAGSAATAGAARSPKFARLDQSGAKAGGGGRIALGRLGGRLLGVHDIGLRLWIARAGR